MKWILCFVVAFVTVEHALCFHRLVFVKGAAGSFFSTSFTSTSDQRFYTSRALTGGDYSDSLLIHSSHLDA
ncbi:hypothetical protein OUZ56_001782 [Daphnia magna]|uniref:Secreted protein n=1 Tax=Daphnia magna TaxID=35525 RepID=A0ABR0A3Q6_9CRUS|nr:hypothetical protein OUZ56_001782 [Daphnia magna]